MAGEAKQHAPYNWVKGQGPNIPAPPPLHFLFGALGVWSKIWDRKSRETAPLMAEVRMNNIHRLSRVNKQINANKMWNQFNNSRQVRPNRVQNVKNKANERC